MTVIVLAAVAQASASIFFVEHLFSSAELMHLQVRAAAFLRVEYPDIVFVEGANGLPAEGAWLWIEGTVSAPKVCLRREGQQMCLPLGSSPGDDPERGVVAATKMLMMKQLNQATGTSASHLEPDSSGRAWALQAGVLGGLSTTMMTSGGIEVRTQRDWWAVATRAGICVTPRQDRNNVRIRSSETAFALLGSALAPWHGAFRPFARVGVSAGSLRLKVRALPYGSPTKSSQTLWGTLVETGLQVHLASWYVEPTLSWRHDLNLRRYQRVDATGQGRLPFSPDRFVGGISLGYEWPHIF